MSTESTNQTEATTEVKEEQTEKKAKDLKSVTTETIKTLSEKDKISLEDLLKNGVHFGHQKSKWNPKMKKYVYTIRNGFRIFDLNLTKDRLEDAVKYIKEKIGNGQILFVGTKRQSKDIVLAISEYLNMPYVVDRWLGGTLTNFKTLRTRIDKLMYVEDLQVKGELKKYTKKEQSIFKEKLEKFNKRMGGIKQMKELPKVVFVVDLNDDKIAVREANRMGIPVVAIADTNTDPSKADYVIPANDDAVGSIKFIMSYLASRLK